jgi:hypothetical protein
VQWHCVQVSRVPVALSQAQRGAPNTLHRACTQSMTCNSQHLLMHVMHICVCLLLANLHTSSAVTSNLLFFC